MSNIIKAETPAYSGELTINVNSSLGFIPINNATITISYSGDPDSVVQTLTTNDSGQTSTISLPAPSLSYSTEPSEVMPYAEYNISVSAPGYEPVFISGTEILPDVTAVQPVTMTPIEIESPEAPAEETVVIPDHTLYGEYPPKIPEDEIKPMDESGEIVLSRVVIPEYIIVHDGVPQDPTAKNYYVRYTDYIKNVVSSEIYATWPENTIYANTLVIMSFTLNRVYTEWYRNHHIQVKIYTYIPPDES
ncbi:MAG: carboxypeptidase regulatory-like domain-containing protein [Lachnospiraceae bacterium]|nr:carboxypeptidase regulatory-like domain-containing protein [Lachnospiraceae bacterium]